MKLNTIGARCIAQALEPYGFVKHRSITHVPGPGSYIVMFAGMGDFYTACLTHDFQVVWVMSCGGREVDSNTEEANALFAETRKRYRLGGSK